MRHCHVVPVRAPKVEPRNVPIPEAVISAARPEPPTPSSSRASMTSPTLTIPTAITATVEEASSSFTPGRAAISRVPERREASSDVLARAIGALSGIVASRTAEMVKVTALTAIRVCGSNDDQQARRRAPGRA